MLGYQSSVPWDSNDVFWPAKKLHTLFAFAVLIKKVMLLVNAVDWDLPYKYLMKKIAYDPESSKCIMHQCESCPGTATLKKFLDQELNEHEDD